ncbi:helix-turn-helix domain-containing protein [Streptomyces sp. NPDC057235]|uniref:helix-turn-helix domain-containing protein n=1 Tax=Streptomyces sp. NPDC057235 TaxID=3346058 RepID=UPI0036290E18
MATSKLPQPATELAIQYLTPESIAFKFKVPLETVYQWRKKRTGPPGFRVGKHVRYASAAVLAWVAQQSGLDTSTRIVFQGALPDRYLAPEDIAAMFSVSIETVYHWRKQHTGPPGFRVGKHVRYDPAAVQGWVAQQSDLAAAA